MDAPVAVEVREDVTASRASSGSYANTRSERDEVRNIRNAISFDEQAEPDALDLMEEILGGASGVLLTRVLFGLFVASTVTCILEGLLVDLYRREDRLADTILLAGLVLAVLGGVVVYSVSLMVGMVYYCFGDRKDKLRFTIDVTMWSTVLAMGIVDIPSIVIALVSGYEDGFSQELDIFFFLLVLGLCSKNLLVLKIFEFRYDWSGQYFAGIAFLYLWICCFYGVRIIDDPES